MSHPPFTCLQQPLLQFEGRDAEALEQRHITLVLYKPTKRNSCCMSVHAFQYARTEKKKTKQHQSSKVIALWKIVLKHLPFFLQDLRTLLSHTGYISVNNCRMTWEKLQNSPCQKSSFFINWIMAVPRGPIQGSQFHCVGYCRHM